MKIVVNATFGGFSLSERARNIIVNLSGIEVTEHGYIDATNNYIARNHPALVKSVEVLGDKSYDKTYTKLSIVEIPDNVEWEIVNYDGFEHVAEKHRTWFAK